MKNLIIEDEVVLSIRDPNVEKVVIPEGVTRIEDYAFSGAKIKKVVFPESLLSIGEKAFENCVNLEEICLNEWFEDIEESAFSGCKNLCRIELNKYICTIEDGAFEKCNNVKEVECNGNETFSFKYGCLIEDGHIIAASFGNPIPTKNDIDTIKSYAYCGDGHFVIKIPQNIKCIEEYAFLDCDYLNLIEINHEMEYVAPSAFCAKNLNSVILASKCGNILNGAFSTLNGNRCDIFLKGDYVPTAVYNCIYFSTSSYLDGFGIPKRERAGTHNIWLKNQWKEINGTPVSLEKKVYSNDICNVYFCGVGFNVSNRTVEIGIKIEDLQDTYGINKSYFNKIKIRDFGFDYVSYIDEIDTFEFDDMLVSDIYSWEPNVFYFEIFDLNKEIHKFKTMFVEFDIITIDGKVNDSVEFEIELSKYIY